MQRHFLFCAVLFVAIYGKKLSTNFQGYLITDHGSSVRTDLAEEDAPQSTTENKEVKATEDKDQKYMSPFELLNAYRPLRPQFNKPQFQDDENSKEAEGLTPQHLRPPNLRPLRPSPDAAPQTMMSPPAAPASPETMSPLSASPSQTMSLPEASASDAPMSPDPSSPSVVSRPSPSTMSRPSPSTALRPSPSASQAKPSASASQIKPSASTDSPYATPLPAKPAPASQTSKSSRPSASQAKPSATHQIEPSATSKEPASTNQILIQPSQPTLDFSRSSSNSWVLTIPKPPVMPNIEFEPFVLSVSPPQIQPPPQMAPNTPTAPSRSRTEMQPRPTPSSHPGRSTFSKRPSSTLHQASRPSVLDRLPNRILPEEEAEHTALAPSDANQVSDKINPATVTELLFIATQITITHAIRCQEEAATAVPSKISEEKEDVVSLIESSEALIEPSIGNSLLLAPSESDVRRETQQLSSSVATPAMKQFQSISRNSDSDNFQRIEVPQEAIDAAVEFVASSIKANSPATAVFRVIYPQPHKISQALSGISPTAAASL